MEIYRQRSSDPRENAQRNLMGRTHYVDPETLRYHKSRILSARHTDGGLLFAITTSDALDMHNTRRGYRYVIFDLFGRVIDRPDLEHAFRSHDKADKTMRDSLNKLDASAITLKAIERERKHHADIMAGLEQVARNQAKVAAS